MTLLIIGLALFILTHMIPSVPRLRTGMVGAMGENGYKGLFSLLALAGLGLIIYGSMQAPFEHVWSPPGWAKPVAHSIMPFAIIIYTASFVPTNLKRLTRHPMLWGTFVWGAVHLLNNGDLASILLFGSLALFSIVKIFLIGDRQSPEPAPAQPYSRDAILVVVGLTVYSLILYFHEYLSGVALIQ